MCLGLWAPPEGPRMSAGCISSGLTFKSALLLLVLGGLALGETPHNRDRTLQAETLMEAVLSYGGSIKTGVPKCSVLRAPAPSKNPGAGHL